MGGWVGRRVVMWVGWVGRRSGGGRVGGWVCLCAPHLQQQPVAHERGGRSAPPEEDVEVVRVHGGLGLCEARLSRVSSRPKPCLGPCPLAWGSRPAGLTCWLAWAMSQPQSCVCSAASSSAWAASGEQATTFESSAHLVRLG